jgi:SAM-dependent methyltransferase
MLSGRGVSGGEGLRVMHGLLEREEMRDGWNARATRNPFFYVESACWNGDVDDFFARGEATTRLLIDRFRQKHCTREEIALDIGCGLGRFSGALAKRFASVIAVDISDEMIANARQLHLWPRYDNIKFETNDGIHLPVPDDAIDFVWSYEILQHAPTHEIIRENIREIGRVLRPGGLAAIHLKTGYQHPPLHTFIRHLPDWAITLAARITRQDFFTVDRDFQGAAPLSHTQIETMVQEFGLTLLEVIDDPTHSSGTRAFALVGRSVPSLPAPKLNNS